MFTDNATTLTQIRAIRPGQTGTIGRTRVRRLCRVGNGRYVVGQSDEVVTATEAAEIAQMLDTDARNEPFRDPSDWTVDAEYVERRCAEYDALMRDAECATGCDPHCEY